MGSDVGQEEQRGDTEEVTTKSTVWLWLRQEETTEDMKKGISSKQVCLGQGMQDEYQKG